MIGGEFDFFIGLMVVFVGFFFVVCVVIWGFLLILVILLIFVFVVCVGVINGNIVIWFGLLFFIVILVFFFILCGLFLVGLKWVIGGVI